MLLRQLRPSRPLIFFSAVSKHQEPVERGVENFTVSQQTLRPCGLTQAIDAPTVVAAAV